MKLVSRYTQTQVALKFLTEQSAEQIILALDSGMVQDVQGLQDATITEKTVTRLSNRPEANDYTGEILETAVRYPSYRGPRK